MEKIYPLCVVESELEKKEKFDKEEVEGNQLNDGNEDRLQNPTIPNEIEWQDVTDDEILIVLEGTYYDDTCKDKVGYSFKVFIDDTEVGGCTMSLGSHRSLKYYGNIGYEIYEEFRGNRLAAKSVKLLLPWAKKHGQDCLYICCDPKNVASRRTCELSGGILEEIVKIPDDIDLNSVEGHTEGCRFFFDLCDDEVLWGKVPSKKKILEKKRDIFSDLDGGEERVSKEPKENDDFESLGEYVVLEN